MPYALQHFAHPSRPNRQLEIRTSKPHGLSQAAATLLRSQYCFGELKAHSVSEDLAEWQTQRHGNPMTAEALNDLQPATYEGLDILDLIAQMLWERETFGYPWKPVQEGF